MCIAESSTAPLLPQGHRAAAQQAGSLRAPSRASSGLGSWQDVNCDDAGGSSEDLTDMDDTSCVSLAPRRPPRLSTLPLPSLASLSLGAGSAGGIGSDGDAAAPAQPPASVTMLRGSIGSAAGPEHECGKAALRMRRAGSASQLAAWAQDGERGTYEDQAAQAPACLPSASAGTMRTMCAANAETDMLWTFLAGMLLYVTAS